jgi:hypothetical protein
LLLKRRKKKWKNNDSKILRLLSEALRLTVIQTPTVPLFSIKYSGGNARYSQSVNRVHIAEVNIVQTFYPRRID